jgi:hypothetical protein
MDFVAYNEILICDKPIRNEVVNGAVTGYTFEIKYPSYRGCWLSCIEALDFFVDGEQLEPTSVYFRLNGKEFTLEELPDLNREYWYVNRPAVIRIIRLGGIPAGEHQVRVYMKHRVPYTGYFGQYLTLDSDRTKTLTAN